MKGDKNMFGRKLKKAQKNLLKAMDIMRICTEYIDCTGSSITDEYLSLYQALESIRDKKHHTLTNVFVYQCVPGTEFRKLLLVYDAKHDILTSPMI